MNKKLVVTALGVVAAFGLFVFATVVYVKQNREERLTLSSASEIKEFLPVRAGKYTQWISSGGTRFPNYKNVNEAVCNNGTNFNYAFSGTGLAGKSKMDSYGIDITN
jgi:hypothetical protein